MKVNTATIDALMVHIRHTLAANTEVREVCVSKQGVGFYVDSRQGEHTNTLVAFDCWPTNPTEGQAEGGWNITARRKHDNLLVGEWVAQGGSLDDDWHAAWFSVMSNCSGANYWLRFIEVDVEA